MENQSTVTLGAGGKEVRMSGDDFERAADQMEFVFVTQYSDIALREAIRGVKAITREAIRLGADVEVVSQMLALLADDNEMVYAAANAIEEALQD